MPSLEEIAGLLKTHYPFRKLDDARLLAIAERMDEQTFEDGELIFQAGNDARHLYFVYSGAVTCSVGEGEAETVISRFVPGDLFGYEMLGNEASWQATAVADGQVLVTRLFRDDMQAILEDMPELVDGLEMLYDSYHLSLEVPFDWRKPDEAIYFMARKQILFLALRMAPVALLAVFTLPLALTFLVLTNGMATAWVVLLADVLAIAGWGLWNYVDWANDYSVVTSQRVINQERVVLLYDSRQEAPLNAVLSVTTSTDQWGRWLKYGDVIVRTYAGVIVLPKLANPQQVVALIEGEWARARVNRTAMEKAAIAKMLRERLGMNRAGAAAAVNQPVTAQVEPGELQRLFANLFRMRFESGSTITYRTHWFFLLRHIFFPTLFFLAVWVVFFLRAAGVFAILSVGAMFALTLLGSLVVGLWWLYQYTDWRNDYYVISDDQVLDVYKKPLGREERQAAPLRNIQSIEFKRIGLLGLLLNYGTVYIRVGDANLTFDYVFNPADVQQELFRRIAERDYKDKRSAEEKELQRTLDLFQIYHRVAEEDRNLRQPPRQN